jgi:hypothetical protein
MKYAFEISDVHGDYLRDFDSADSRTHPFGSLLRASWCSLPQNNHHLRRRKCL